MITRVVHLRPTKANPATGRGGVRTPILLTIPRLVRTLAGGQTRHRLLRHNSDCNAEKSLKQKTSGAAGMTLISCNFLSLHMVLVSGPSSLYIFPRMFR